MTTPPRRRWFQFGLRTMFVGVTVFAVWLGWELRFIRERKSFFESLKQQLDIQDLAAARNVPVTAKYNYIIITPRTRATIPFWRKWLGDEAGFEVVRMPKTSSAIDLEKAKALFPESKIEVWQPPPAQPESQRKRRSDRGGVNRRKASNHPVTPQL
ncbi:MAG TPA: hypothetical protein VGJ26_18035 [Pirellulales bacterium]|jgi:hypothetical protein